MYFAFKPKKIKLIGGIEKVKVESASKKEVLPQNIENKPHNTEETITQDTQSDSETSIKSETKDVT